MRLYEIEMPETINGKPTRNSLGKLIHTTEEGINNFWKWFGDSKVKDNKGRPLVVYHGTNFDIEIFNTSGGTGKTANTGAFFTNNRYLALSYSGSRGGNISIAYLRMINPVEVNAANVNWNSIGKKARISTPSIEVKDEEEEIEAALMDREPIPNKTKIMKPRNTTMGKMFRDEFQYGDESFSTDDLSRWARRYGHEGVIFKGIRDRGPFGNFVTPESSDFSNLYVVYNPNQIKSAIGNNGNFSTTSNKITEVDK